MKLCPTCLIANHNESERDEKASHVQTIGGYVFKFGEDYGEVIHPRTNNPAYEVGDTIHISPNKTIRRRNTSKRAFVIP